MVLYVRPLGVPMRSWAIVGVARHAFQTQVEDVSDQRGIEPEAAVGLAFPLSFSNAAALVDLWIRWRAVTASDDARY